MRRGVHEGGGVERREEAAGAFDVLGYNPEEYKQVVDGEGLCHLRGEKA